MSSLAAGHKALLPQLVKELKKRGGENEKWLSAGYSQADYQMLYDAGAVGVFGPEP
jgi:methylmalonyl-CoA mutase